MTRFLFVVAGLLLGHAAMAGLSAAQFTPGPTPPPSAISAVSFRAELMGGLRPDGVMAPVRQTERSIPLAFVMSAALPGAGQAYNRDWVKAAVGISIEAAAITAYSIMRTRGLRMEDDFRAFAHRDWSPGRYALYLNDYTDYLNLEFNAGIDVPRVHVPSQVDFTRPEAWTSADEAAVAQMISEIRTVEGNLFHAETGAALSHQIPTFASQQYYELIGKYFQFAPGWEDYPEWGNLDDGFTPAIDPVMSGPGDTKPNVSAKFYAYADEHGQAQDLLRSASRMTFVFILNHVAAGIDAAISAKLDNDRIETSMGMAYGPDGRMEPVTTVSIRF